jgi:hypothetical protein
MDALTTASSPVCYASEAGDDYMGFADRGELARELNLVLETERANAKLGSRLADQARHAEYRALAKAIRANATKGCRALTAALEPLGVEPSQGVADIYGQVMAVSSFEGRLALVNFDQGRVARRLEKLLPRIRHDALHRVLRELLQSHVANIDSANTALDRHIGASTGAWPMSV